MNLLSNLLAHFFSISTCSRQLCLLFSAFCFSRIDEIAGFAIEFSIRLCSIPHTVGPKMKKNPKFVDCLNLRSIFLNSVLCLVSIAFYILCVVKIHSRIKSRKKCNCEKLCTVCLKG